MRCFGQGFSRLTGYPHITFLLCEHLSSAVNLILQRGMQTLFIRQGMANKWLVILSMVLPPHRGPAWSLESGLV